MKWFVLKAALLASAAFSASSAAAQTQDKTPADVDVTEQAAEADSGPTNADGLITVTGSRVITNGNNAPTPVTVVTPEALTVTRPGRIFESLQELPIFSGSRGVTGQPSNAQPNAGTAVSALNLRNLGGLRALALFDGRRVPPTTPDGYVNINTIPQLLLQRVDIVTGGASAVYGSDAVTGVVNFITDRRFNGVKAHGHTGISHYGDNFSYDVGIAAGTGLFGGRGHIEASYQRILSEGIPHKNARDWTAHRTTLQGNGTTVPYHLQDNVNIAFATFGGLIVCPGNVTDFRPGACPTRPLVGQTFDQNGVLTPFEVGLTGTANGLTDSTIQIGGDGAYHTWPSLAGRSEVDQGFGRFDFDVTDDIHFYVQGSYTRDVTTGNPTNLRFFGRGVNISSCNAFLAPQYRTALGCTQAGNVANTAPTFTFNKIFNYEQGGLRGAIMESKSRSYFVMAGLEGKLGESFRWDLGYTHSTAKYRLNVNRNMDLRRTYAALDAVDQGLISTGVANGNIVCRVTITHPTLYPGCVPVNVFGPSAESQAADDYIFSRVWHDTTHKLDDVAASISGSPFSLWAGPIDVAISGEYRRATYSLVSNSPSTLTQDCVGLRLSSAGGNCAVGGAVNINVFADRSPVKQQIWEGAGEVNIPLVKDETFFENVNVNLAARYTHYKNDPQDGIFPARSFNAFTWKAGATWAVTDWLTLRGARSRDIRAPNLFDLYAPRAVNPNSFTTDYLQTPAQTVNLPLQTGGNPDLQPEVAYTTTLGMIVRPTSKISIAIDYYDIKITGALGQLNGQTQAVQEACYNSNGASALCDLIVTSNGTYTRGNGNRLVSVFNRFVNIAGQRAKGWDFEANFRSQVGSMPFSLRALVTYQPTLIYSQALLPTQNQAGASYNSVYLIGGAGLLPTPKWKASLFAHINLTENFALDISQRWRSGLALAPKQTPALLTSGRIPSAAYTNVTGTFTLPDTDLGDFTIFFNVQNLFNKDPALAGTPQQQTQPGLPPNGYVIGDDVVGRYYTAGVRIKF